jgi:PAS domain S-box-containing protein
VTQAVQRLADDSYVRDLERRLAELELRCEEYRMLDETADAVPFRMTTDLTRFLYVGPQAERLFGIAQREWLVPGFFEQRLSPEDRSATFEQYRLVVEFGASHEAEFRVRRDDGNWAWLRCSMRMFESSAGATLAGHFFDITVRRTLASDLAQFQRLEAVGRLAAGIAHEINTPVQFIGDNVAFAREGVRDVLDVLQHYRDAAAMLPASEVTRLAELEQAADLDFLQTHIVEALQSSSDGLATVATLVRSMKAFAHPDKHDKEPSDINEALRTTTVISTNEHKYIADVKTELEDIPLVSCLISELNQVFLNIIVNAAHAIGEVVAGSGERGTITIATRVDGAHVVIAISDTGGGIPEHVRGRIFDPFFTTKEVGKGTGQGLSIASTIIQKHAGALTFETEMGKGTTFFVRVPIES